MNEQTLSSLKEALKHSPDNNPLRLLLAETYLAMNRLNEAEEEFTYLARNDVDPKAKFGLADVYYRKGNYSACNVILEEIIDQGYNDSRAFLLYSKGLMQENSILKAREFYQKALLLDPNNTSDDLDEQLRLKSESLDEYEDDSLDHRFLEKPNVNFSDVGGMDSIKKEIDLKIIKPLTHPEMYKAYGKKVGGGILLYGPPGCGKTYLAKATAGQVNAKFISVGLNDILDMWIGNSEKNLHDIFELARDNSPCVFFVDEIDALGASRTDMKQSSGRHLINQFLQELDGIESQNEGILIIGATNTPWNLDPAFRRPGRFDRILFVPPPDEKSRESILRLKLKDKPIENLDYLSLAKKMNHYSGADIDAIIDRAIEYKLEGSFEDGQIQPISNKDLLNAIKIHKPSTQEWFATAKNFALFANDSGLYDEILDYLKIKK
ncbi:AAA family ATPase [Leptospira sp. GIMC2001]|uniref:AAA family ATPase n=1 Tax=Leptospira sp. GIMC2001 TaxID=1513297 RepID=UPI00234AF812|nr:AAA family ATPase [Leptospira sp. GIMC2001]WCL50138.1 AAA family ATPase [Leptospira sp. GIMC2001]